MAHTEQQFLNQLEKKLWTAADKLRSNLDAAVYKHAVLGLIFLKYVSDAFEERREELKASFRDPENDYYLGDDADEFIDEELEMRDYYTERNIFWVPQIARWKTLQDNAKLPIGTEITIKNGPENELGQTIKMRSVGWLIDTALDFVEKENPKLKGVLNKNYTQLQIDPAKLGELIDLIVEMLKPYQGRVYDPAMGSGGFFVQSERFVEAHGGKLRNISVYGQESNPTTWRLAAMNMAIRGIDFNFGKEPADSFNNDRHPDLRADFVMANPPFNMKEWSTGVKDNDPRWQYGIPPAGNANFAWMQHMLYHLAPNGSLGLLLANGSMSSNTSGEGDIRRNLIEADLVECMVALPGQLFTNTQIPACIWFLTKNKKPRTPSPLTGEKRSEGGSLRDRTGQILFIDARNLGYMKDRVLRDFRTEDIDNIAGTFHAWRHEPINPPQSPFAKGGSDEAQVPPSEKGKREVAQIPPFEKGGKEGIYQDIPGFCKSATLDEIKKHDYVLTPGRYVGAAEEEDDSEPFAEKMARLTVQLKEQFEQSDKLEIEIRNNLARLGYDV